MNLINYTNFKLFNEIYMLFAIGDHCNTETALSTSVILSSCKHVFCFNSELTKNWNPPYICMFIYLYLTLSTLGKIYRWRTEIFLLLFPENRFWHFKHIVSETICMKCQILFSGKNKKKFINLSSAEFAYRVVKVNTLWILGKNFSRWHFKDICLEICIDISYKLSSNLQWMLKIYFLKKKKQKKK